jgi:pimeloyl-ACP methyl ester carboxylesterase
MSAGRVARNPHPLPTLLLSILAGAAASCGQTPQLTGRWIGDASVASGPERIELEVDAAGAAMVSLRGWGLHGVRMARDVAPSESLAFTAMAKDTVGLRGVVRGGRWSGELTRGGERIQVELRRVEPYSAKDWTAIVGTFRAEDGRLLGIAPFSEFGPDPMLVDYGSGRIAPLYPVSRSAFLIGPALISPVLAIDSLEVVNDAAGGVHAIRVTHQGEPPVVARRVETRDEEVRFSNGAVTLGGTLTLPPGPGPHPGLVLVHGSNAQTRDAFGPWTRFFVGQGFAVLSFDKRGTGVSTGDWKQADFAGLAGDVLAGVRLLEARTEIRSDRIGLWGISQAGWIMPMVAAEAPDKIAFLVVHAGTGTTVQQQGVLNRLHELRASGLPERSVAVGARYQELDDVLTRSGKGWEELQRFYEAHRGEEPWLTEPDPADAWFRGYYRMLMDFDPAPFWRRVTCPVLLFYGELDVNVPPAESWPPIERALRAAANREVEHVVLPKANHVFLEARTGARDEYPGLTRFVPGYFDRMAAWLAVQRERAGEGK